MALLSLLDNHFRANPDFVAVPPTAGSSADVVLLPRSNPAVAAKLLSGASARLLAALAQAGPLPAEARAGPEANRAIARLVLEGVLEVEHAGRFVSGPSAHAAVFPARLADRAADGPLAALSLRALRYGQALALTDVRALAWRLYTYGATPRGPRWDQLLGQPGEASSFLGLGPGGLAALALAGGRGARGYQPDGHPHWLSWSRDTGTPTDAPAPAYKLYVSPRTETLGECFPTIVGVLVEHHVRSFKVGRGVSGLLRPDKIVAYFDDVAALRQVASALGQSLAGVSAHGVPFTAATSDDGLTSFGMDPIPPKSLRTAATAAPVPAAAEESWRSWVTQRLASGIVAAAAVPAAVQPWEYALDRLALEGVDSASWLPPGAA